MLFRCADPASRPTIPSRAPSVGVRRHLVGRRVGKAGSRRPFGSTSPPLWAIPAAKYRP